MCIDISPKPNLDVDKLNTVIRVGTAKPPRYLIMNYSTFTTLRNQTTAEEGFQEQNNGIAKVYYKYQGLKICICEAFEYGEIEVV